MTGYRRWVALFGFVALVFAVFSGLVGMGAFDRADAAVARFFARIYNPGLQVPFQAVAVLGGIEVTTLLAAGIGLYLWRRGFRSEALAALAFPAVVVAEALYKLALHHPGPGHGHPDGPSLSMLFESPGGNSYPSGHEARAVVVYGLLAFLAYRLGSNRVRRWAGPVAVTLLLLIGVDRLYLDVHWESDVIGALLLGGLGLLGAVIWLDRPRPEQE